MTRIHIKRQFGEAENLKHLQQDFQLLVTSVKDYAIFMLDVNGNVTTWNSGAEAIKGYSADQIIGKNMEVFYTAEDRQKGEPQKNLENALKLGHFESEGLRVKKDGSTFYANVVFTALYDDESNLYGFAKVTRDITEKRKTDNSLRFLATIAENIQDPVISSDNNFIITRWNTAAEKLFGWKSEEAVGQESSQVLNVSYADRARDEILVAYQQYGYWQGELICHTKLGNPLNILATSSHLKDTTGEVTGNVVVIKDITARKKNEDMLKKMNEDMEAFSYSISHDLRAPLRGIVAFTKILGEDYGNKLDDEARRIMQVIIDNTLKMGNLIDDLLAFSKTSRYQITKTFIDMNAMVAGVVADLTNGTAMDHKVKWVIAELPEAFGDKNTIRQVWINLISNAIKYSAKKNKPQIEIRAINNEHNITFFVKDNGVGFDEKYKSKLFKVFQRLHGQNEFEGTGVGLAIVQKIISKHGGEVWVNAGLNKGATFYFSLLKQ